VAPGTSHYGVYYWRVDQRVRWQRSETVALSLSAGETQQVT
jgi:hypothetical protein